MTVVVAVAVAAAQRYTFWYEWSFLLSLLWLACLSISLHHWLSWTIRSCATFWL